MPVCARMTRRTRIRLGAALGSWRLSARVSPTPGWKYDSPNKLEATPPEAAAPDPFLPNLLPDKQSSKSAESSESSQGWPRGFLTMGSLTCAKTSAHRPRKKETKAILKGSPEPAMGNGPSRTRSFRGSLVGSQVIMLSGRMNVANKCKEMK